MVDHILPNQGAKKEHQPAMPWRDVPAFTKARLRDIGPSDNTRAALLFLILTAARSGEIRGATWGEFDLKAGIWTVPGERMKAKVPHRVPLSAAALDIVKTLKEQKQHKIESVKQHGRSATTILAGQRGSCRSVSGHI
ncbi:MAG: tyrosine-type recombinase/integrase [Paraburkholderia tropica]|nr:tyrosine-type recombinase/integrase [Paraburkholderia tropica]